MRSGHAAAAIAPVVCAGVGVRYGSIWAIRLASFKLAESDLGTAVLGILTAGPAARAPLAELLAGRVAPAYGNLCVLGHDMRTARGRSAARRQVGVASRGASAGSPAGSALGASLMSPAIRVRGLIERAARLSGQPEPDRHLLVAAIIDRLALSPWAEVQLRAAPALVARKARLAAACVHQPKLLLIDGLLDQLGTRDLTVLADVISGLRGDTAVIVLGDDADVLSLVSDRVLSLANGVLMDSDARGLTASELAASDLPRLAWRD